MRRSIVLVLCLTLAGCASTSNDTAEAQPTRCSTAPFLQPHSVDLESSEAATHVYAALYHHQQGRLADALYNWRKAEVTIRQQSDPSTRGVLFYNAAVAAAHLGNFEQARGLLENIDQLPDELQAERDRLKRFIAAETGSGSAQPPENGEESTKKEGGS